MTIITARQDPAFMTTRQLHAREDREDEVKSLTKVYAYQERMALNSGDVSDACFTDPIRENDLLYLIKTEQVELIGHAVMNAVKAYCERIAKDRAERDVPQVD